MQNSLRAWKLVHECPQPLNQSRNKILKGKGKYKQLRAKRASVKMWTDTGFNQEQMSLCKGTAHYSGHQAPCQTFMCPSKIVLKLFIRKSELPPCIFFFKWLFFLFLQLYNITWLILYPYCTSVSLGKGINVVINHMNKFSWQFFRYRIIFHHSSSLQNDSMQTQFQKQTYSTNYEQMT